MNFSYSISFHSFLHLRYEKVVLPHSQRVFFFFLFGLCIAHFSSDGIFSESFKFCSWKSREVSCALARFIHFGLLPFEVLCRVLKVKEESAEENNKERKKREMLESWAWAQLLQVYEERKSEISGNSRLSFMRISKESEKFSTLEVYWTEKGKIFLSEKCFIKIFLGLKLNSTM